jgi:hypothetical protein
VAKAGVGGAVLTLGIVIQRHVTQDRRQGAARAVRKEVSELRGEGHCRDDKKIAVETDRRASCAEAQHPHSAEAISDLSPTQRPCGQLIVVDDGYDLFMTLMLYPTRLR